MKIFKIGDRVKLTKVGSELYGCNMKVGDLGTVTNANYDGDTPNSAIRVAWDRVESNYYAEKSTVKKVAKTAKRAPVIVKYSIGITNPSDDYEFQVTITWTSGTNPSLRR